MDIVYIHLLVFKHNQATLRHILTTVYLDIITSFAIKL